MVASAVRDRQESKASGVVDAQRDGSSRYVVEVPGGQLAVTRRSDGHLELTGPAVVVAHGDVDLGALGSAALVENTRDEVGSGVSPWSG